MNLTSFNFVTVAADFRLPTSCTDGYWVKTNDTQPTPDDAVFGGLDTHNNPTYVIRGYHDGNLLPGKLDGAPRSVAGFNKREVYFSQYEVWH